MNKINLIITTILLIVILIGCSKKSVNLTDCKLDLVNREIISLDKTSNTISINNKKGDGMAVLEDIDFNTGTIEVDLKGENTPGMSFIGIAFNIQNDSTYEAVYFRPFNFQSKEKIRREHSIQYISHPKNTWRYLRTNHEGQYEAEYYRQPLPEEWFTVSINIENDKVSVYDMTSNEKLLSVNRIESIRSNKIGLWMGNNSKGQFRNLKIQ